MAPGARLRPPQSRGVSSTRSPTRYTLIGLFYASMAVLNGQGRPPPTWWNQHAVCPVWRPRPICLSGPAQGARPGPRLRTPERRLRISRARRGLRSSPPPAPKLTIVHGSTSRLPVALAFLLGAFVISPALGCVLSPLYLPCVSPVPPQVRARVRGGLLRPHAARRPVARAHRRVHGHHRLGLGRRAARPRLAGPRAG